MMMMMIILASIQYRLIFMFNFFRGEKVALWNSSKRLGDDVLMQAGTRLTSVNQLIRVSHIAKLSLLAGCGYWNFFL